MMLQIWPECNHSRTARGAAEFVGDKSILVKAEAWHGTSIYGEGRHGQTPKLPHRLFVQKSSLALTFILSVYFEPAQCY